MGVFDFSDANYFSRNSGNYGKGGHIFGDNSSRSHYCSHADGCSRKNNSSGTDKNIIFYFYRRSGSPKILTMNVMLGIVYQNLRSNIHMISNCQRLSSVKKSMITDNGILTDSYSMWIKKITPQMNYRS